MALPFHFRKVVQSTESVYFDRKCRYSTIAQVVWDDRRKVISFYSGWQGSCADSSVYQQMQLSMSEYKPQYFIPGEHLLADSAYPDDIVANTITGRAPTVKKTSISTPVLPTVASWTSTQLVYKTLDGLHCVRFVFKSRRRKTSTEFCVGWQHLLDGSICCAAQNPSGAWRRMSWRWNGVLGRRGRIRRSWLLRRNLQFEGTNQSSGFA